MRRLIGLGWIVALGCSPPAGPDQAPGAPTDGPPGASMSPTDPGGGGLFVPTEEPGGGLFGPGLNGPDLEFPEADCTSACTDFPAEPVFDVGVTAADIAGFGNPGEFSEGLCLIEPQLSSGAAPGALFPANWTRPRFRWAPVTGATLYEIRLSNEIEVNDLVAYTRETQWIMPTEAWEGAGKNIRTPITATVRALNGSTIAGATGTFEIAPVNAGGSIVFWSLSSAVVSKDSVRLFGFGVGDEGVIEALTLFDVEDRGAIHEEGRDLRGMFAPKPGFVPGDTQCIGCHTSTPDGTAVVFTDDYPWNKVIASVAEGEAGVQPSYVTPGSEALLKEPWLGTQTMSPTYWRDDLRVLVGSRNRRTQAFSSTALQGQILLAWWDLQTPVAISPAVPLTDVGGSKEMTKVARDAAIAAAEGTAWGVIATTGETRHAVLPDWSHDGETIVYVSTDVAPNGHPSYAALTADIRLVDFNAFAGGQVRDLPGAATAEAYEYYPDFSGDDKFIAFNRSPSKNLAPSPDGPYYNRFGEIHVIPTEGGTSLRLRANDPVACTGAVSPGVINSWPKWSPGARTLDGKTYYFVIFSSARSYEGQFDIPRSEFTPANLDTRSSQLYMAAIVVDEDGTITDYPAIYLWNQNNLVNAAGTDFDVVPSSNLTPAWDEFVIPPVVVTVR